MWDLPGPGIEPVSLALAGGFLSTAPPGKSLLIGLYVIWRMLWSLPHVLFWVLLNECHLVHAHTLPDPQSWLWSQQGSSWLFLSLVLSIKLLDALPFCLYHGATSLLLIPHHQDPYYSWHALRHGIFHAVFQIKTVTSGRGIELLILMACFFP